MVDLGTADRLRESLNAELKPLLEALIDECTAMLRFELLTPKPDDSTTFAMCALAGAAKYLASVSDPLPGASWSLLEAARMLGRAGAFAEAKRMSNAGRTGRPPGGGAMAKKIAERIQQSPAASVFGLAAEVDCSTRYAQKVRRRLMK